MDRETRVFAESYFRGLRGRPAGGVGASPGRVDFIERPDSFSYADFFKGYLLPNVPCVFSSAFTEGWGSRRHWVTAAGKPDFEHLLRKYGEVVVPVANCGVREYNSNPKEQMLLRDYIGYWKDYIQGGCSSPRGCLYLKDWHLCRDSLAEDVFTLPMYFSSDWLNEYWDTLDVDDYRFIYMGPAGTWMTLFPSTTTGSTVVTWPICGTSCSKSSLLCSRRSVSGGTRCLTGTNTVRSSCDPALVSILKNFTTSSRSSLKGGSSSWPKGWAMVKWRTVRTLGWAASRLLLMSAGLQRCWHLWWPTPTSRDWTLACSLCSQRNSCSSWKRSWSPPPLFSECSLDQAGP
uniref:2-oxoglutarate and iron-dependent oxygenase JMJD4 isoform X4 n=1 Tax=Nyctereutes procyonoides TaxID=34880 RepID=UPI002444F754|nr:2-oxoglutarate and iron-dependent oxygenase JMJD4 isoform X4 [Nyctereutes procyonoides]